MAGELEIKTAEQIQLKKIDNHDRQFYSSLWLKRKWVSVDSIIRELEDIIYRLHHDSSVYCWEELVKELIKKLKESD